MCDFGQLSIGAYLRDGLDLSNLQSSYGDGEFLSQNELFRCMIFNSVEDCPFFLNWQLCLFSFKTFIIYLLSGRT